MGVEGKGIAGCLGLGVLTVFLLSSCNLGGERFLPENYAAWSGEDNARVWTRAAERAVEATSLAAQLPDDIRMFCPRYPALDADARVRFWVTLLSAMAKFESNFEPATAFIETLRDSKGRNVVSRGLLQLSIESANQQRYGCRIADPQDLHDASINLTCGAQILSAWVVADGVVAFADDGIAGGGRYWSVLRPSNRDLEEIRSITRGLDVCMHNRS